jgi:RNA polymerase sigma-70 factor, ECF subfamily
VTEVHTITNLLREVRSGAPQAVDKLMAAVYPDLRNIAGRAMSSERGHHTLQPTALVAEYYMRLFPSGPGVNAKEDAETWKNRAHFFSIAARQMRQILVDHARKFGADKRGNKLRVALNEEIDAAPRRDHAIEDIDTLLTDLERKDPNAARVVELKFFGGLTDDQVAEVLGSNRAKVRRDWEFARSWLFHNLNQKFRANS